MNHFKTQYNGDNFEHNREVFTLESLTQPDMAMSINDMLKRHEGGLPVQGPKNPERYYNVPEEIGYMPDVRSMDMSEIQDYREMLSARVKDIKAEQKLKDKEEATPPEPPAPDPGEEGQQKE